MKEWRKSDQYLLPEKKPHPHVGGYDIYPSFRLDDNQISNGFKALSEQFLGHKLIIIEGYTGVFYDHFREKTDAFLKSSGGHSWTYYLTSSRDVSNGFASRFGWGCRIPLLTRILPGSGTGEQERIWQPQRSMQPGNLFQTQLRE